MPTAAFAEQRGFEFKEAFCQIPTGFTIPPTVPIDVSQIARYQESFVLVPMSAPPQYQALESKLGYAAHYDPNATQEIPKDTLVMHYAGELILSEDGRGPYVIEIPDFSTLAIDACRMGNISRFLPSLPSISEVKMFDMPDEIRAKVATQNLRPQSYITVDGVIGMVFKTMRAITPGTMTGFSYYLPFFLNTNTIPLFYTETGVPLDPAQTFLDIRRYFVINLVAKICIRVDPLLRRDRSLSLAFHGHPLAQLVRQFDNDSNYSFEKFEEDLRLHLQDFGKIIGNCYQSQKGHPTIQAWFREHLQDFLLLNRILTESPEAMCDELLQQFQILFPVATNRSLFRFKHENETKKRPL